jgi:septin family protein
LGDFTLANGTTYRSAVLREATSSSINIGHSSGFSKISIADLPEALRAMFVFPPVSSAQEIDPGAVLARKPAFLKSEGEFASDRAREIAEFESAKEKEEANRKSELDRNIAERAKAEERRRKEMEESSARQAEYNKKFQDLQSRVSSLEVALSEQENLRRQVEVASQSGSIRLAAAEVAKRMAPIDERIASIRSQIATLEAEMARLPKP